MCRRDPILHYLFGQLVSSIEITFQELTMILRVNVCLTTESTVH